MQYQKEDVRNKIMVAGADEFLENGYRGGKIGSIAAAAGVPIGNLYRYFDGKEGLLDAIVSSTYNLIPRYVAEIAAVSDLYGQSLGNLAAALTRVITELLDRCGKELLILLDRCEGSKFDDFKLKLYALVNKYMNERLFRAETKEDEVFCYVVSKAFLDMLFDILRKGERDNYGNLINRLLVFCFYEAEKRS
ncbi:MAG: TetR/AcrR family transcriptional regulator [Firmicutes bacterium]|nr:TetR/AcrR family transcriptional regulator [Bacillota bacterium]